MKLPEEGSIFERGAGDAFGNCGNGFRYSPDAFFVLRAKETQAGERGSARAFRK